MSDNRSPVRVVIDGPAWLVLETDLERIAPPDALRWFIEPELLAQWWGEECTIDPVPGGHYEVRWPSMNWTMRGQVLICDDTQAVYSWSWDHEPDLPARGNRAGGTLGRWHPAHDLSRSVSADLIFANP